MELVEQGLALLPAASGLPPVHTVLFIANGCPAPTLPDNRQEERSGLLEFLQAPPVPQLSAG